MIENGRTMVWVMAAAIGLMVPGALGWAGEKSAAESGEGRPISEAESLEFGKGLAEAFMKLDSDAVTRAVDFDAIIEAAAEGVKVPPGFRDEFLKGAKEAQERDGNPLIAEVRAAIQAGAVARATKGMRWQDRPACLVRVIGADLNASYIVFLLERAPEGHIRAVDHYSLASGELASRVVRRIYLAAVAEANLGLVDRLFGKEEVFIKHIDDLNRMIAARREGRAKEILTIYGGLPEELKNEKVFQILRYTAAQEFGDQAKYLEAIQDFARRFPDDPVRDFLMIDGYILMDPPEPAKSLECIDRLEKTLDGDAYIKVMRGSVLTLMERADDALASYRAAIAEEPDLRPAYDIMLDAALVLKRFGEVAEMLDALESVFGEEIVDLSQIDLFDEFLASPEGKAWTEKRARPKDDAPTS